MVRLVRFAGDSYQKDRRPWILRYEIREARVIREQRGKTNRALMHDLSDFFGDEAEQRQAHAVAPS